MAEPIDNGTEQAMTPAEFEQLAKTDINQFLEIFLEDIVFVPTEDDEDDEDTQEGQAHLCIQDVEEYRLWGSNQQHLGLHLEEVDSEGGFEGAGDHAEIIFAVMKGEEVITHFQINGYYSSYDGTEWEDSVTEVEPREVLVTQWFTKGAE